MYNNYMSKIGILGGAFDPPHKVHIMIAEAAIKECGYDKIIFLPSYNPPHKKLTAESVDRLAMLKLALKGKYEICELEIGADNIGYTVNTIPKLKKIYGDNIEYIIGGDSMRDLHTWNRPDEILKSVKLTVAVRDGDKDAVINAIEKLLLENVRGIYVIKQILPPLSSSHIRLLTQLGLNISNLVDKEVEEYIMTHNLYTEFKAYREKLKANLSVSRYEHTLRTTEYAVKLSKKFSLDYDKVFLAGLLHDCAKEVDIHNIDIPEDSKNTPIAHAFAGKIIAKQEYGIVDTDILNAIKYHSTGRPNMSILEKIIYCADMLEDGREWDGIDYVRKLIESDFEEGFKQCLNRTIDYLKENNKQIYPLTIEAYEYYNSKE